jgi:TsgA-like MFS transporter
MSLNQIRLMFIPLLATLIMAGFVTTIGLLTEPAANHFGVPITEVASQFSWLAGGVFVGGIVAFFIYDHGSIKTVITWSYLIALVSILLLHFYSSYWLVPVLLAVIGTLMAVVGCGGVTVITQQWLGRRRQSIMVAQDAMFNGGGIMFSAFATWFVVNHFGWSSVYLIVTLLMGIVVLLAVTSDFTPVVEVEEDGLGGGVGSWNTGIILVGFSLLLFMTAKIAIFVWAPQFIQQNFGTGPEAGGQFMANVFLAAFVGSIFGTWAATRFEVKYLLYTFVLISLVSVFAMTAVNSTTVVLLLGYGYGISVSATYNSYVAFGLSFMEQPSHKNVVYLQLMSGLGSTIAPFVSSKIVEWTGETSSAIFFCAVMLAIVAVTLIACEVLHRRSEILRIQPA